MAGGCIKYSADNHRSFCVFSVVNCFVCREYELCQHEYHNKRNYKQRNLLNTKSILFCLSAFTLRPYARRVVLNSFDNLASVLPSVEHVHHEFLPLIKFLVVLLGIHFYCEACKNWKLVPLMLLQFSAVLLAVTPTHNDAIAATIFTARGCCGGQRWRLQRCAQSALANSSLKFSSMLAVKQFIERRQLVIAKMGLA